MQEYREEELSHPCLIPTGHPLCHVGREERRPKTPEIGMVITY